MKIFAISDIHGESRSIDAAAELIASADMVTISGDFTKHGTLLEASQIIGMIESLNKNIIAVHGNCDRDEVRTLLEEKGYCVHGDGRMVGDVGFFGVGGSIPSRFGMPSEYPEESIMELLNAGYDKIKSARVRIMISHPPPYGIVDKSFLQTSGGSKSVREFIGKNQLDLCISGHIHEAKGHEHADGTAVVNVASFKKGEYYTIEIDDEIKAIPGKL